MVGKLMGGALGMTLVVPTHRYAGGTPHLTPEPSAALRHATRAVTQAFFFFLPDAYEIPPTSMYLYESHVQHYTNALALSVMVGKHMRGALGMTLVVPTH
eukprot:3028741-Prymnesium_polylepis.1